MAVPKRKTSKSNTKMRRAANSKMEATGFVSCPQCHSQNYHIECVQTVDIIKVKKLCLSNSF
ncbi:ribosomal protein L32 [Clostridioides difficile 6042]|nr:ribosomal protein L32 [Clostridioides difficile 6042]